jgi:hypothetical protein
MHCREARRRLTGSRRSAAELAQDRELLEHLERCPNCARDALAAETLRQMLSAGKSNDTIDVVPLTDQRKLVEARVARGSIGQSHREATVNLPGNSLARHPLIGAGAIATVVIVVLLALVPFGYHRTVGYEIAFAGISPELVEDGDQICDVLYALGLAEAAVDVIGCDTTCNVLVFDLKSKHEAQLVVAVLERMNRSDLDADLIPVRTRSSGSLLEQANQKLLH